MLLLGSIGSICNLCGENGFWFVLFLVKKEVNDVDYESDPKVMKEILGYAWE